MEDAMKKLKISMGIWGINNLPDRFNVKGFGEEIPILDRIKIVGETEGIDGIELHLPTEIDQSNQKDIERVLNDYGLKMVQLCGHTWTEKQYKNGALADLDPKIRANAIARVKEALDMGARFDVPISVLWPATDGSDFPLQSDYLTLYDFYVDSVKQILGYLHQKNYKTRLCLEPKPFEPRAHILYGTTGQALCLVNEINDPSFGINLDIGHSLIGNENLEGLDLFPYRDHPVKFMKLSVENLNLAQSVVELMKERGSEDLRRQSGRGPEMSALIRDCIREAR